VGIEDIGYVESSGNVFADLEIEDADDALTKAELARAISTLIAERRLTQVQASVLLGVDQPKISALLRGRLTDFSIDRLLRFLLALDWDVEIVIKPGACPGGRVHVVTAS
jgi:predicted XRE-type DNA-binding protein